MSRNRSLNSYRKMANFRRKLFIQNNYKITPNEAISKLDFKSKHKKYVIQEELKKEIKEHGKRITDFANEMNMKISLCCMYINGYIKLTDEFQLKRIQVFKKWDSENVKKII